MARFGGAAVTDADRDAVAVQLREHYAVGRLSPLLPILSSSPLSPPSYFLLYPITLTSRYQQLCHHQCQTYLMLVTSKTSYPLSKQLRSHPA